MNLKRVSSNWIEQVLIFSHSKKKTSSGWFPKFNEILALDESSMKLHRLHTEASYWHEENDECRVPKMPGNWQSGNCLREVNMNSMHPGSRVACNSTAVPSTFTFPKSCSSNLVATWKKHQTTLYNASVQSIDLSLHSFGVYICTSSKSQPRWISRA